MSDNQDIQSVTLSSLGNISGSIGASSFIINDYLLTLTQVEGGYNLVITKGSQTQTAFIRDAVTIDSIEQIVESEEDHGLNTIRVTLSDGTVSDFNYYNGSKGDKGDPGLTPEERQNILDAEAARISAENQRVLNEQNRVSAEEDRALFETIRRGEEAERVQQEKNRNTNESARITAESARSGAEAVREYNEGQRQSNEISRQSQWEILKDNINEAIGQIVSLRENVQDLSEKVDGATSDVLDAIVTVNNQIERAEDLLDQVDEATSDIINLSAVATTLSPGSQASASYSDGVLTIGVPQGIKGNTGDAFHIVKTYSSISEMNADYSGTDVNIGEFVMIASTVEDPDNAKVYVKGDTQYNFVVDMSGAAGIQGVGISSIVKTGTSGLVDTYTITYTNNTTSTFTIKNGEKGDKGAVFVPSVDILGNLSWSNDGGLPNPGSVNIKGAKGDNYVLTAADKAEIADAVVEDVIDDTAGDGDTDKTWSADKIAGELANAGTVQDVQVNGVSVLQDGVANVPRANTTDYGVVRLSGSYGIQGYGSGSPTIGIMKATDNEIKIASSAYRVISPEKQNAATFYGLAKASGDTTQSQSSNPVGQYTDSAKSAISQMLNGSVSVTGTTPSITALPGIRYVCGEVSTLDIILPASGIVDVVFESGSTPTVLTITPPTGVTLKWANGFDPTALEANTTYEINIADGLGVAGKWS